MIEIYLYYYLQAKRYARSMNVCLRLLYFLFNFIFYIYLFIKIIFLRILLLLYYFSLSFFTATAKRKLNNQVKGLAKFTFQMLACLCYTETCSHFGLKNGDIYFPELPNEWQNEFLINKNVVFRYHYCGVGLFYPDHLVTSPLDKYYVQ